MPRPSELTPCCKHSTRFGTCLKLIGVGRFQRLCDSFEWRNFLSFLERAIGRVGGFTAGRSPKARKLRALAKDLGRDFGLQSSRRHTIARVFLFYRQCSEIKNAAPPISIQGSVIARVQKQKITRQLLRARSSRERASVCIVIVELSCASLACKRLFTD
jgi:hypothetical protein